ncbi:hypothetical protein HZU72_07255 [Halomonas sp. QX-2]|uniref:Uncharacterized protein n=1 Tax=Vreelandella sedimenti TaxID=2729618 RepID=A0A7Z0N5Y6_9GAMM|nr:MULTISPECIES: hypothetical protein [Halomonas]NYT72224.1 hypothetical protein [Halomonas sedimenti]|tara:strand:- start:16258 stop:16797 length:540 start_codon:yes stop_codon:yes gene_type:complete
MGQTQTTFLTEFLANFDADLLVRPSWTGGGQGKSNTARLETHSAGRRGNIYHSSERFELGDLTANIKGHKVVIEFESKQIPIQNLLKYWPYLRGELSTKPTAPVIICHFSDWWSYGINRDLWEWTLSQMQQDRTCIVPIQGKQFDHGGSNTQVRQQSIRQAAQWVKQICAVQQPTPLRG